MKDVTIIGGGLAGLTLALQVKNENPNLAITVLEKRKGDAPMSAHKVGESTVELGTYYLREVLNLKDYLDKHQLPKRGLRYFFSPHKKNNLIERLEIGPKNVLPVPSHQLDRGILENDLINILRERGIEVIDDASVNNVHLENGNHTVSYTKNEIENNINTKWVVDTSGRNFFLKKKLELQKDTEHNINAVWWRYKGVVDIEDWTDDEKWLSKLNNGIRKLATVHLMDKGYWVWIIPLVSGNTSIGIVSDPRMHPLNTLNTYEKAMEWLAINEPQAHKEFIKGEFELLDFMALKNFSYDSKQFYAKERWAVSGEAGAFLDPFYSPGTDFISLNNSWVTNLITRDFAGEDIRMPAMLFEITHKALLENWIPIYNNKYNLFGSSQIMTFKIFWDWTVYWGIPCITFMNKGYTDLNTLKQLFAKADSPIPEFAILSKNMQDFFLDWLVYDEIQIENEYIDFIEMDFIKQLHFELNIRHTQDELIAQIEKNIILLEQVSTYIYQIVTKEIFDLDEMLNIDPYTFNLKEGKEALVQKSESLPLSMVPLGIQNDINKMWFKKEVSI